MPDEDRGTWRGFAEQGIGPMEGTARTKLAAQRKYLHALGCDVLSNLSEQASDNNHKGDEARVASQASLFSVNGGVAKTLQAS